ncbi:hypothetical protein Tco_0517547 [Tanacetum coccineum]
MDEYFKYIKSLEKEVDEFETQKLDLLNEYDLLLQECVSNDIMCKILRSLNDIDQYSEFSCTYLDKTKECQLQVATGLADHRIGSSPNSQFKWQPDWQFTELAVHRIRSSSGNRICSSLNLQFKWKPDWQFTELAIQVATGLAVHRISSSPN